MNALENDRNITLIAPRRMGKTGLVKHLFYQMQRQNPDQVFLYMDIFSTQNLNDFVRLFAATLLGSLDSTPQKAIKKIGAFIRSFRPVFTLDSLTGNPRLTVDFFTEDSTVPLKELFDYLGASGKRIYIAIDEIQQLAYYPEKGVEALLRSHIQFLTNTHFVFSGSQQHVMQEMFLSPKRPFYHSTQIVTIDCIDQGEYYRFAAHFFKKAGYPLSREVFDIVYTRFDGHTWYVQSLLNRLYGYRRDPEEKWVEEAIREIVDESGYAFENLLAAYTTGQVKLLKAIASEGYVKEIVSHQFISRYGLSAASSIASAVQKLLDRELVYKSKAGYCVYDKFLAIWLRRHLF